MLPTIMYVIALTNGTISIPRGQLAHVPYFAALPDDPVANVQLMFAEFNDAAVRYVCSQLAGDLPAMPICVIGQVALFADYIGADSVLETVKAVATCGNDISGGDNIIIGAAMDSPGWFGVGVSELCNEIDTNRVDMQWLHDLCRSPACVYERVLAAIAAHCERWEVKFEGLSAFIDYELAQPMMYCAAIVYLAWSLTKSGDVFDMLLGMFKHLQWVHGGFRTYPLFDAVSAALPAGVPVVDEDIDKFGITLLHSAMYSRPHHLALM